MPSSWFFVLGLLTVAVLGATTWLVRRRLQERSFESSTPAVALLFANLVPRPPEAFGIKAEPGTYLGAESSSPYGTTSTR